MKKTLATLVAVLSISPFAVFADVSIGLVGGSVTVRAGSSYVEPGYSAFSTVDGDVTSLVSVTGIDTSTVGKSTIWYSVTDSALDTANAYRSLNVVGGGSAMPYCSGPLAPGWVNGIPGGGCGGKGVLIPAGQSTLVNGKLHDCPFWFGAMGCMVN